LTLTLTSSILLAKKSRLAVLFFVLDLPKVQYCTILLDKMTRVSAATNALTHAIGRRNQKVMRFSSNRNSNSNSNIIATGSRSSISSLATSSHHHYGSLSSSMPSPSSSSTATATATAATATATASKTQSSFFQQSNEQSSRRFSNEATATAVTKEPETDKQFQHAKAEALFQKMILLQLDEIHTMAELIPEKLGLNLTEADRLFGTGAAVAVGAGGDAAGAVQEGEPKEEKTHFDLKLVAFDAKSKIKVIKEIRSISGLGLKEAKDLVDGAPKVVKKDIKLEEAEELKKKLEAIGATIELG
jgi:large subunit ribosomal protein L7/L12